MSIPVSEFRAKTLQSRDEIESIRLKSAQSLLDEETIFQNGVTVEQRVELNGVSLYRFTENGSMVPPRWAKLPEDESEDVQVFLTLDEAAEEF